jgi:predicted regulator of Ras-like GTPase activity (Roadblock/LC7/MglB family)
MHSILLELNGKSVNIEASAIISKDGLIIASTLPGGINDDQFAGITAALFSIGFHSVHKFTGAVDEMVVKGVRGNILITNVGKEVYLAVITTTNADLEPIFFELKRSAIKISDHLISKRLVLPTFSMMGNAVGFA